MAKPNKKRFNKRLRNMVIVTAMSAIVLVVSTFAWFIGTQTVNVSEFDVEIAAVDGLTLSLDGAKWDTTVNISKDVLDDVSYTGHTNSWGGAGLVPVSSVGKLDEESSRLVMYEKSSLTSNTGGYRIMASRIKNDADAGQEDRGYVAFDLFIRNLSGRAYMNEFNILNEEGIYLSTDSSVTVASGGVANTGIENSVRVAFAQIGRVEAGADTSTAAAITGISCEGGTGVTSICSRTATIWEPNDTKHVSNAINYYNESCKARTAENTYGEAGTCETITDDMYVPTYAINQEITDFNVNVYDGEALNGYTTTVGENKPLKEFTYFTDTDKIKTSIDRPEFMYLAPNSITKVRVYIYLEGQDIDNQDFAAIGRKIAVKFGFTKQRYTEGDIEYVGDSTIAPSLTVPSGSNPLRLSTSEAGDFNALTAVKATYAKLTSGTYVATSEGAGETNPIDTEHVTVTGTVGTEAGEYEVSYELKDDRGYVATTTLRVIVTE